eukprot:gene2859-15530_t
MSQPSPRSAGQKQADGSLTASLPAGTPDAEARPAAAAAAAPPRAHTTKAGEFVPYGTPSQTEREAQRKRRGQQGGSGWSTVARGLHKGAAAGMGKGAGGGIDVGVGKKAAKGKEALLNIWADQLTHEARSLSMHRELNRERSGQDRFAIKTKTGAWIDGAVNDALKRCVELRLSSAYLRKIRGRRGHDIDLP